MKLFRSLFKLVSFFYLAFGLAPVFQVLAQRTTVVYKTSDELLKEIVKWQEPERPLAARQARVGGLVVVYLEVDERGNVVSAKIVTGDPLLDAVMLNAARAWKFRPAKVNNVPVRLAGTIDHYFPFTDDLLEKTINDLEVQVRKEPAAAETHCELANAYIEARRYEDALLLLSTAIRINPECGDAYLSRGHAYSLLNSREKALEAYTEASRLDPDSSLVFHSLGLANFALGKYEEAVKAFKHSLEADGPITTSYFMLGKCYVILKRPAEALEPYKAGLAKRPESDVGHYGLGEAYLALEQYPEAINEFKQAIKLAPLGRELRFRFSLCLAYLGAGDKESALKEYKILKPFGGDEAEELLRAIKIANKKKSLRQNRPNTKPPKGAAISKSYE